AVRVGRVGQDIVEAAGRAAGDRADALWRREVDAAALDAILDRDLVRVDRGREVVERREHEAHAEVLRSFRLQASTEAEARGRGTVRLQLRTCRRGADVHRGVETFAERRRAEAGTRRAAQGEPVGD